MKSILQTRPTLGTASPYRLDEWIRTADNGYYVEVEIPAPTHNRTAQPDNYLLLYLLPRSGVSIALANPPAGIHEIIEAIMENEIYELAFRRKWPLLDGLLVENKRVAAEFAKRPILISVQDPDDGLTKWMVGRQLAIPADAPNTKITDIELAALESLLVPTLRLRAEVQDVYEQVVRAFIRKEFEYPKSGFDKFREKFDKVMDILGPFTDALSQLSEAWT